MAPKQRGAKESTPAAAVPRPVATPQKAKTSSTSGAQDWSQVLLNIYDHYVSTTPQRTKLIDTFMAFLVVVGAMQFLYCILAGNYVSLAGGPGHPQSSV